MRTKSPSSHKKWQQLVLTFAILPREESLFCCICKYICVCICVLTRSKTTFSGQGPWNVAGHSRNLSSSTEDGSSSAQNSETSWESEETAAPAEQNRNISSPSESWRKVEVLYRVRLGSSIRRLICETIQLLFWQQAIRWQVTRGFWQGATFSAKMHWKMYQKCLHIQSLQKIIGGQI